MRSVISFLLVLGFVSSFGFSQNADAVEFVEPTLEQKAHCEALADERSRQLCLGGYSVRGLKFPDEAEELGFFTNASRMAIFKPKGNGPFPALLLLHSCAAVDFDPQHMRYWVSRALEEGYVAFVVDSWGQRGISELCKTSPPGFVPIHLQVRARDAYEALRHLGKFDFVDTSRVAAMGFSNGGRVTYLLGSKEVSERFSPGKQRFVATVAVYGQCFNREFKRNFVLPDIDVPLLSLLGELDEDGDPRDCLPRLQALKEKGAPVEWHVFPNTGHAWDSPKFSPPRRFGYIGNTSGVLFAYDAKVADESRERAFEFLARHLKRK